MGHFVESMMYEQTEKPWHGLGKAVKGLQTAEEAIIKAGLDWEVELLPVYIQNGKYIEIPDRKAVSRKTDHRVYNVVGNRYAPIQNKEAFNFFDAVVGTGKACYETAGSLGQGKRIWILANIKGSLDVAGEEIKRYLVLTNSHDGTLACQMFWTPIRVVCWNTLQSAVSSADTTRFYSRHTTNALKRIEAAQEILGLANNFYNEWHEQAKLLASRTLPKYEMPKLLAASFGLKNVDEVIAPYTKREMERVEELVYVGRGQNNPKIQGTAWQAFNGIAEYADYNKPYRGEKGARFKGVMFGSGASMKRRAWAYLIKNTK